METASALIISGLIIGLSNGLAPGPLLTLTISQTLRYGPVEGVKIALAPLITDLPIILAAVYLVVQARRLEPVIGVITLCGAGFLLYLGWESISFKGADYEPDARQPKSFRKGILANFLNPSPYLFWVTIGGPLLAGAWGRVPAGAVGFLAGMYVCLVGSKMLVAIMVGRSRAFLRGRGYIWTMRVLGLCLWAYAVYFIVNGLKHFGLF